MAVALRVYQLRTSYSTNRTAPDHQPQRGVSKPEDRFGRLAV